jgi:hypothetical protein
MRLSATGNLMVETLGQGIRVMRFERPDLRDQLYDDAQTVDSPLYCEILDVVLSDLPACWTLIVNLNQITPINTAFYRCLLQIRRFLYDQGSRLILCNLSRQHLEVFELFQAFRIFTVVRNETDALCAVAEGKGVISSFAGNAKRTPLRTERLTTSSRQFGR